MQTISIINPYSKSRTYCITLWIVHTDPCTFHLPAASLPAAQRQRARGHAGHRHAQLLAAGAAPGRAYVVVDVPHALPIRRRSDCLALCMASFSCSLPRTFCLRMLPTMTMREPSMSTAKSVPTSGLERLSKNESCGRIGVSVRVGGGVEVGALGPCGPQAPCPALGVSCYQGCAAAAAIGPPAARGYSAQPRGRTRRAAPRSAAGCAPAHTGDGLGPKAGSGATGRGKRGQRDG